MKASVNHGLQIVGVITLVVASFFVGKHFSPEKKNDLSSIVSQMKNGDSLVISESEVIKGERESTDNSIRIDDKATYSRICSWFGLSAVEGAAKHQALDLNKDGSISVGGNKGYGVIETLWVWIKDVFVTFGFILLIGGVVLVAMMFIPQTSAFANSVIRIIGSFIPGVGSFIENIFARFKYKKPLTETIEAIDKAKADLRAYKNPSTNDMLTGEEAWKIVSNDLAIGQDEATKIEITNYGN